MESDCCLVCGKRLLDSEMKRHIQVDHCSPDKRTRQPDQLNLLLHCPFCPFQSECSSEIQNHVDRSHGNELLTPVKEGRKQSERILDLTSKPSLQNTPGDTDPDCSTSKIVKLHCPVCTAIDFSSANELTAHVNRHFDVPNSAYESSNREGTSEENCDELLAIRLQEQERDNESSKKLAEELSFKNLQEEHGMGESHCKVSYKQQAVKNMEKSVGRKKMSSFEYYNHKLSMLEYLEEGVDDGTTTTSNLTEFLRREISMEKNGMERIILTSDTDHIGHGYGDAGWGCGYRNLQMMISCLNRHPRYSQNLHAILNGKIPSIPRLQQLIEKAWSNHYDHKGKEQLGSKLVSTRKWIGATEIFSLLASLKLHCRIVDFTRFSGQKNTHPKLLTWIAEYFEKDTACKTDGNVMTTTRPPLYLQHQGHSRTVVGVVLAKESYSSTKLIIFDPGHEKSQLWRKEHDSSIKKKASKTLSRQKLIKSPSSLKHPQYQIVCVEGLANSSRIEQQKDVDRICEKIF